MSEKNNKEKKEKTAGEKSIYEEIKQNIEELISKGKKIDVKKIEEKVEKSMDKFFEKAEYTSDELKEIIEKVIDVSYKTLGDSIENVSEVVSSIASSTLKAMAKTKKYSEKTMKMLMDVSLSTAKNLGIKLIKAPFMAFEAFLKGIFSK